MTPTELLQIWHNSPPGDQARLLAFGRAMVEQRQGKRAQRAQRHQVRPGQTELNN